MKHILLSLFLANSLLSIPISANVTSTPLEYKQFIITDCGTIHEIDADASPEEALKALDYWASVDCQ